MDQLVENENPIHSTSDLMIKKETIFQKFASFKGRIGREDYFKRTVISFVGIYGAMIVMMIGLALFAGLMSVLFSGRAAGGITAVLGGLLMVVMLVGMMVVAFSLVARRLHDLGYSGWWILGGFAYSLVAMALGIIPVVGSIATASYSRGPSLEFFGSLGFMINLILLLMVPLYLVIIALGLWPGNGEENQYGPPTRKRNLTFSSNWEQVKKEFFSFSGRLNRKWFIGMMFAISFYSGYIGAAFLIYGAVGIGFAFASDSIVTGIISCLTLVIGLAGILIACYSYISLLARRVHDMGYSRWVGVGFFFLQILLSLISVYLVIDLFVELANMSRYFRHSRDIDSLLGAFKGISAVSSLSFLGMLLMMALPGTKGENKYGVNPVDAGLLPGEKQESTDEKITF